MFGQHFRELDAIWSILLVTGKLGSPTAVRYIGEKNKCFHPNPRLGAFRGGATTALAAGEEVPLRDLTSRARHQRFLSKAHQILPSDTKFGGVGVTSSGVKFNKWPPLKGNEFSGHLEEAGAKDSCSDLRIPLDIQVILEDFSLKPPRKRQQKTIHSKQHVLT